MQKLFKLIYRSLCCVSYNWHIDSVKITSSGNVKLAVFGLVYNSDVQHNIT